MTGPIGELTNMTSSVVEFKEDILKLFNKVLEKQDERLLRPILERDDYKSVIASDQYEDLVKLTVDHIEVKVQEAKLFRRQFEFYENILCEIARVSLSEGMLLSLIEYGTENSNDVFLVVLKPLTLLFDNIVNKCTVIQWCFHMIETKLSSLTLENHKLEGEELTLLELDNDVEAVTEMYTEALKFYVYIVNNQYETELKPVIVSSLVTILGNPMINADLESREQGLTSKLRDLAEKIVCLVCNFFLNPVKFYECAHLNTELLKHRELILDNSDASLRNLIVFPLEEFPSSGLSNFFYLIYCENMSDIPKVYSHVYLLVENVSLSSHLINSYSYLCIQKGLKLIESSLVWIEDESLSSNELFQVKDLLNIFETLINLIIYNDMKGLRLLGLKVFQSLLVKSNKEVLFLILIRIESILSQHSGLKSEVINTIIIKNLNHYKNKKLYDLINIYCKLSNGIETDVVENKETIISSLNLLKYVKLNKQFSKFNETYFSTIETNILKVLEEALKISKQHYEAFLEEVKSGKSDRKKPEMSVKLFNNHQLPAIDPKRQAECLKESLCAIDLIQWNLSALF